MSANFNLEIQSEHFENGRSITIEGCNIKIVDKELNGSRAFHYHFSNYSRQDSFKTYVHMMSILEEHRCTMWQSTDGRCK